MSQSAGLRLHRFLQVNIVLGFCVFLFVTVAIAVGNHTELHQSTAAASGLNFYAVAGLFYSYLFWLADLFSRPLPNAGEGPRSRV